MFSGSGSASVPWMMVVAKVKKTTREKAAAGRKTPSRTKASAKKKTAAKRSAGSKSAKRKPKVASRGTATAAMTKKRTAAKSGAVGKLKGNKKNAPPAAQRPARATAKSSAPAKPTPSSQDPIQFPEESRRIPKTHLSAKELRAFRELLLTKRAELCGDVQHLTDEALSKAGGSHGERSSMPIHMAELGSDTWEKEFTLGLIANEQARVREIDAALERIEKRTYGVCLATHNKIETARLLAKPWAKYCIEYARAREEGRAV